MTKATPRRPRSDSVKAAVAAHENAAKSPLEPPAHVRLRDRDRQFWDAIVQSRARDTWTDSDLAMAASLARAYGDIEALQEEVDEHGFVVNGKPNPAVAMLEAMTRRVASLSRILHVHAQATVGRSQDAGKTLQLELEAREAREDQDDDLIPRLEVVRRA